jgi:hypothetical protein
MLCCTGRRHSLAALTLQSLLSHGSPYSLSVALSHYSTSSGAQPRFSPAAMVSLLGSGDARLPVQKVRESLMAGPLQFAHALLKNTSKRVDRALDVCSKVKGRPAVDLLAGC